MPSPSSPLTRCIRLSPKLVTVPGPADRECLGGARLLRGLGGALLCFLLSGAGAARAQSFAAYTLKAGPTLATQRWDNFEQSPLVTYHADLQVERMDYSSPTSFYASVGYHRRGSAIRSRNVRYLDPTTGQELTIRPQALEFAFSNVGLTLGGKQHYAAGNGRGFVAFGLRGEYNVATDFGNTDATNVNYGYGLAYPNAAYVRKVVYGMDLGVGLERQLSARLDALFELRISPDVSQQYDQPPLRFYSPVTGNNEASGQRRINNVGIEFSVGLRLLPETVYE